MLDRFTDRARKVMSMAKQEALDLHSNKVGTEHLLLALAKEEDGIAAEALRALDISYDDILEQLKEIRTTVPAEDEPAEAAKLAFTPLVISVMERSFRLARENNQTYVSTEHLLLAIVSEGNGLAMDIFQRLGVSGASVRASVERLTAKDQGGKRPMAGAGAGRPGAGLPFFSGEAGIAGAKIAGGTLELAGGVETLCGREDELSSFEHAANSTAAQSAGANSFHTVFFTTKHFLSLWGIPLFVIRPAGTKYFIFPHVLRKFHKTQTKRGEARPPRFVLICPGLAPAHGQPFGPARSDFQ